MRQTRGPKIIIFRRKRHKNHRRTQGHRQDLTLLKINMIAEDGKSLKPKRRQEGGSEDEAKAEAKAAPKKAAAKKAAPKAAAKKAAPKAEAKAAPKSGGQEGHGEESGGQEGGGQEGGSQEILTWRATRAGS